MIFLQVIVIMVVKTYLVEINKIALCNGLGII